VKNNSPSKTQKTSSVFFAVSLLLLLPDFPTNDYQR
jgi:hypothetical protein